MNVPSLPGVSVLMPTYNEAGNIQALVQETAHALKDAAVADFELIIVDDDSPDRTWEKAAHVAGVDANRVKVIRRMRDHGLTASLREGIAAARHEIVVWMDCDFSHPPDKIPQMLFMIDQGFDVVVNSRYVVGGGEDRSGKGGATQLVLSRLLNWGTRFMLKPSFSDYTSGFVAVRRRVLDEFELRGDYGEYFIDFIYRVIRSRRVRVCELPYVAPPRRSGESKTGNSLGAYLRRGRKYILTVLRLRLLGTGRPTKGMTTR
ncbi:MAG: glycosyltransferase [Anaerolineales bacterium]